MISAILGGIGEQVAAHPFLLSFLVIAWLVRLIGKLGGKFPWQI